MESEFAQFVQNKKKSINRQWGGTYLESTRLALEKYKDSFENDPRYAEIKLLYEKKLVDYEMQPLNQEDKVKMSLKVPSPAFYKEGDDITKYIEKLERYFVLAKVPEEEKCEFLLYLLDDQATKIKDSMSEEEFLKKDYNQQALQARAVLGEEDKQTASVSFFNAMQKTEHETIFASRVKALAAKAEIKDAVLINNKVITGLNNPNIKFEMLTKKYKTFEEMYKELTFITDMKKLAGSSNTSDSIDEVAETSINKIKVDYKRKNDDRDNNKSKEKNYKKLNCYFCGKQGHVQRYCFKYKAARSANEIREQTSNRSSHQHLEQPQQAQQRPEQQSAALANRLGQLHMK